MDFEIPEEERERARELQEWAEKHLAAPSSGVRDRKYHQGIWRALGERGLAGLCAPDTWGGAGRSAQGTCIDLEALGHGAPDTGLVFSFAAHLFTAVVPLWKAGDDAQRERFLAPLCSGAAIGANATSEPENGSNISALQTTAELRNDRYVVNGTKWFSTNGPVADVFIVYATVDPERGFGGVTAFIVERDTPGLEIGPLLDKIGLAGSTLSEVHFHDCEVPVHQRLGAEGGGTMLFAESMRWERGCLFALYLGTMQRQLNAALEFARTRRPGGTPVGKHQSVANRLVDMRLRLETSRLLIQRASWLLDRGRRCDLEISLAKLYVSESAVESSLDAIQIFGGRGCLTDFGVEGALRDAIPGRIFSGTSEIQRVIAARCMGL